MPLNFFVVGFLFSVSYVPPSMLFLGCAVLCLLAYLAHGSLTRILAAETALPTHETVSHTSAALDAMPDLADPEGESK